MKSIKSNSEVKKIIKVMNIRNNLKKEKDKCSYFFPFINNIMR